MLPIAWYRIWDKQNHSVSSHPIFKKKLILSSCLHLGLPSGHFPSGFLTKHFYVASIAPLHATCPTHFILLDLTILIILGKEYNLWRSLCIFLQPPACSSLSDPNILHSILFCRRPRLTFTFLYNLCRRSKWEDKWFWTACQKAFLQLILLSLPHHTILICCSQILECFHIFEVFII